MNSKEIKKNLPYLIILVLVIIVVAFLGSKFLKGSSSSQNSSSASAANGQNGRFAGRGGARGNFKPVTGTISAINGSTINMTASDGSAKTITTTSTTKIMKEENGQRTELQPSDLKVGDTVNIMSSDSSQSTIAAQMIFVGTFTPPQNRDFNQNSPDQSLPQNSS